MPGCLPGASLSGAHAVDATTGEVACGITAHRLQVLDQDSEAAFFVEKCLGCFTAVLAHGRA